MPIIHKLLMIQLVKEKINQVGHTYITVKGNCMEPTILEYSIQKLEDVKDRILINDIYAYHRNGQIYVHRLVGTSFQKGEKYYYFKGDNNLLNDPVAKKIQILGRVDSSS